MSEKSHEKTENELQTKEELEQYVDRYLSIREGETADIVAKSGIFCIPVGQPDLMGVIWKGGSFDNPKDEMRIYDVQRGIIRSLFIQKWLSASILSCLKKNGLKLADLNKGILRFQIERFGKTDWNVQLVDKHYSENTTEEKDTRTNKDDDDLKFKIYRAVKKLTENGEPTTANDIKKEFPDEDKNFIGELLDNLVYSDRKLTREDKGNDTLYGIR